MNQEQPIFKTIDSIVCVKQDKLDIKRIKDDVLGRFRWHSFLLLSIVFIWKAEILWNEPLANNERKFKALVWMVLILYWMYSHLKHIYYVLFRYTWKSKISIQRIKYVDCKEDENTLEVVMRLHLQSGRFKRLVFRKDEVYAEQLMEYLQLNGVALTPAMELDF